MIQHTIPTALTEGKRQKGGVNKPPQTPRPAPPIGQGGQRVSNQRKENTVNFTCSALILYIEAMRLELIADFLRSYKWHTAANNLINAAHFYWPHERFFQDATKKYPVPLSDFNQYLKKIQAVEKSMNLKWQKPFRHALYEIRTSLQHERDRLFDLGPEVFNGTILRTDP